MLILAATKSRGMTIDRITAYDFMTLYGSDFEVSKHNLHGINHFSFSELTTKRAICSDGIKSFVLDGLISVKRGKNGFSYSLTPSGQKYVNKLESDYKTQYIATVTDVHKKHARQSDTALMHIINDTAIKSLRR